VEIRDSIDLLAPAASTEKEQIVNKVLQKVRFLTGDIAKKRWYYLLSFLTHKLIHERKA
jgi:hypothetical protein